MLLCCFSDAPPNSVKHHCYKLVTGCRREHACFGIANAVLLIEDEERHLPQGKPGPGFDTTPKVGVYKVETRSWRSGIKKGGDTGFSPTRGTANGSASLGSLGIVTMGCGAESSRAPPEGVLHA